MIKTKEQLHEIRENMKQAIALREAEHGGDVEHSRSRLQMLICRGTGCTSSRSDEIMKRLEEGLKQRDIDDVEVTLVGCFGFCGEGPIVKVMPDNVFYVHVKPEDVDELIESHVMKGEHVEHLLFTDPKTEKKIHNHHDMSFYEKQERVALRYCGLIDPENVEEYIAYGGYEPLFDCVTIKTP